ncbi:hypothetical protein [Ureibacillus manganicus]|uniref:Histidine kinase n=1 Tax=Ureibacillus manganicus DSM 26584 TaxID=1384049 RepID=A0A0A3IYB5_9BACL|nr:hypothetical protein [Ureibacillus manganicus]KGR79777.1 hypothetical protein CD29_04385 [Ureibacillus manganicus DSM 26584]
MWKHRSKFVIPTMIIVAIASTYMLFNYYSEVPSYHKFIIIVAATLFSGLISALLFPKDEYKIDEKKVENQKK